MLRGTIVYYNPVEGKEFGFIRPEGSDGSKEKNVFFHIKNYFTYRCDGSDDPSLTSRGKRKPQIGEVVLYTAYNSRRGINANTLAPEDTYKEALESIKNRPTYRLRRRIGPERISRLQEPPELKTLWEGKNLTVLRTIFSKTGYPTKGFPTDYYCFYFEIAKDNKWEKCEDPR